MPAPGVGEVRLGLGDLRHGSPPPPASAVRASMRASTWPARTVSPALTGELDDAAGDLRAQRRLPHRLDHAFGGDRLRQVAH